MSFIRLFASKYNDTSNFKAITMVNDFPESWVKERDIDSLIQLISSDKRCCCFVDPLSSYVPQEESTIGGYAIIFINSFIHK